MDNAPNKTLNTVGSGKWVALMEAFLWSLTARDMPGLPRIERYVDLKHTPILARVLSTEIGQSTF